MFVVAIGSWILGSFGFLYLFDILSFPLQARFSLPAAVLTLKHARMGWLRHVIKVSIEKELIPMKPQQRELVLTVVDPRRRLKNALRGM
jgi:hypothetical protein